MKTVVGMVADYGEAEALTRKLKRLGFKKEDIEIIAMETSEAQVEDSRGVFFRSIEEFFGEEAPEVRGYYGESVNPGGMIVSVFVEDEGADRAAAAMIQHGAVRIYNHSTEKPLVEELTRLENEDILGKTAM